MEAGITVIDSIWKVHGTDQPEGAQVTVTGVDGTVLTVQPTAVQSTSS